VLLYYFIILYYYTVYRCKKFRANVTSHENIDAGKPISLTSHRVTVVKVNGSSWELSSRAPKMVTFELLGPTIQKFNGSSSSPKSSPSGPPGCCLNHNEIKINSTYLCCNVNLYMMIFFVKPAEGAPKRTQGPHLFDGLPGSQNYTLTTAV
jgi:hypothetical protein